MTLPLEVHVAMCDFVEFDAGAADRLTKASKGNDTAAVETTPAV